MMKGSSLLFYRHRVDVSVSVQVGGTDFLFVNKKGGTCDVQMQKIKTQCQDI